MDVKLIQRHKLAGPGLHYGILLPNGSVIDLQPEGIRHLSLEQFLAGKTFKIVESNGKINEVLDRLYSAQIEKKEYSLFENNCEHLARRVVSGQNESRQIQWLFLALIACLFYSFSKAE